MRMLSYCFMIVGLAIFGYCAFLILKPRLDETEKLRRFERERRSRSNPAGQLARAYPEAGAVIGKLEIPRLGLTTIMVEGAGERELSLGAGHIAGTSLPGEGGNVGVAGHRDTSFRLLRLMRANDSIRVFTHKLERRYEVVSTSIVAPEDIRVLYPSGHETLTMVTCYPFNFLGPAPKRFIVRAVCVDCSGSDAVPVE